MIKELYTSTRELIGEIGKSRRENVQIKQTFASVDQKLEGINNAIEWEPNRGMNSVLQNGDAGMHDGAMVGATLSEEPSNGERSGNFHPCLDLGKDDRTFGVWSKNRTASRDEKDLKMELDTDSISTGKEEGNKTTKGGRNNNAKGRIRRVESE